MTRVNSSMPISANGANTELNASLTHRSIGPSAATHSAHQLGTCGSRVPPPLPGKGPDMRKRAPRGGTRWRLRRTNLVGRRSGW